MSERDIFISARGHTDSASRAAFLAEACAGNVAMRNRVERLLRADSRPDILVDVPLVGPSDTSGVHTDSLCASHGPSGPAAEESREAILHFLAPPTRPDSLGRLGHYEVLEMLGGGGFGIVFRAFDEALQRVVALKALAPHLAVTSPARKRFLREARSSAAVRHHNVVQVHAVEEQPLPYLVMEYIPGETLQQRLDRTGPLEAAEVLRIGRQIAEGLAAAHATRLIHRDIKPANVLLERGPHELVKLTDFGLARAADDASMTQTGFVSGTPMYMSPEQARGERIDFRSDLFSLGSVLYTMIAGRPPFRAANSLAVLKRVNEDTPRAISELIPEAPSWLCDIIAKLQAKNPNERFQSAREVADLLAQRPETGARAEGQGASEPCFPGPSPLTSHPSPLAPRPSSLAPLRSRRWLVAAGVLLALSAGVGLTEATGVTDMRGTVVRFFTPNGTLVIETDDPDVKICIAGEEVIVAGAGVKELRVKPGEYKVEASKEGKLVSQQLVTVTKNGKQVVRISRETPAMLPAEAGLVAADPDHRAAFWLLRHKAINVFIEYADGIPRLLSQFEPLPEQPFRVTVADFTHSADANKWGDGLADQLATHLKGVHLKGVHLPTVGTFTSAGAAKILQLPEFSELDYLAIGGPAFDDSLFVHLSKLPKLAHLNTENAKTTGKGIGGCASLVGTTLVGAPITADAIEEMQRLPKLEYLNLCGIRCTEQHAAALAKLHLKKLVMASSGLDDAAAAKLAQLKTLESLAVSDNPLTDKALTEFKRFEKLIALDLRNTQATPAGIAELQKGLPKCKIDWR